MINYNIITNHGVYDYNHDDPSWGDQLYEEQEAKCREIGIDTSFNSEATCHFFDSPYFDEQTISMSIDEALQCLAIKDGVDLVQFDNGNYGFIAYYNGNVNGFEVIE